MINKTNMKTKIVAILLPIMVMLLTSCSENYSNGERIGLVTQFSKTGITWKSWEGHLNMTQTGMNSSTPFDFSVDNDNEDSLLIKTLDSAATLGWKVKITYHETMGWNWFKNRGETDHFVSSVQVLDKNPVGHVLNGDKQTVSTGRVVDTIYVVIVPKEKVMK